MAWYCQASGGHTYSILACPEFYNQQHQPFSNGREQCSVFHDPLRVFHGKEHFLGQVFVAVYFSAGSISLLELYRFIWIRQCSLYACFRVFMPLGGLSEFVCSWFQSFGSPGQYRTAFFYAHLVFERFIALFSCYPHLDQIQDIFNSFHRVGLLHELANSDQFHQRDIIPICISWVFTWPLLEQIWHWKS